MSAMSRSIGFGLFMSLCLCAEALAAFGLSAAADRRALESGESFNLTVTARGDQLPDGAPNFAAALGKDFRILGQTSFSNIRIVNGRRNVERSWRFELEPRRAGVSTVPALVWQNRRSTPIAIQVRAAAKTAPAAPGAAPTPPPAPLIFMEASVDRDSLPVRAQLIYTLRVFTAVRIRGNVDELKLPDHTPVRKIHEVNYKRRLNNKNYTVHEWRYACFPQKSGRLRIPALKLNGRRLDVRRSVRKSSKPIEIEVLPIPASLSADAWLPANELTLEEEWSAEPEDGWQVGKPLTRIIKLKARGLLSEQLPDLGAAQIPGLKIYPEQAQLKNSKGGNGIVGRRQETAVLIPTRPSDIELPAIRIPWWDLKADRLRYATLPARRFAVSAGVGEAQLLLDNIPDDSGIVTDAGEIDVDTLSAGEEAAAEPSPLPWWLLGGACIGWACFAVLWWRQRQRLMKPDAAAQRAQRRAALARKLLSKAEQACKNNDPIAARQALMRWAAARWRQERPPSNLLELGRRLDSPSLIRAVENLNRHCYRDERRQWDGTLLLEAVRGLPQADSSASATLRPRLPGLYS